MHSLNPIEARASQRTEGKDCVVELFKNGISPHSVIIHKYIGSEGWINRTIYIDEKIVPANQITYIDDTK